MIATSVGLKTHIWNNNMRCMILLALYPLILMGIVWLIGVFLGSIHKGPVYSVHAPFENTVQQHRDVSLSFANQLLFDFWPIILTAVSIWFLIAWFFHTSMIRRLSHSHPVSRKDEPELYNLLENLCISQGVPMPRLQSANLVRFPFWDYRRYMRHRFTTVTFVDGRHRMIWMHQNGVLRAPVQIKLEYVETLSMSYCGRCL